MTSFESAVFYDYMNYIQQHADAARELLIFDTDNYSAAFVTASDDGLIDRVHLEETCNGASCPEILADVFSKNLPGICDSEHIERDLRDLGGFINADMKNYYMSGKNMDRSVKANHMVAASCSDIEKAFGHALQKLGVLIDNIRSSGYAEEADWDNIRIVWIGETAELYPIQHAIREALSADPFISDSRFTNYSYPDPAYGIKDIGERQFNMKRIDELSVIVLTYGSNSSTDSRQKLSMNTKENVLNGTAKCSDPIFLSADDELRVEINGKSKTLQYTSIKDRKPWDVVRLCLYHDDKDRFIRVKSVSNSAKAYYFPIK